MGRLHNSRGLGRLLLACLASFAGLALGEVNCNDIVLVSNATYAREVGAACEVIDGDLWLNLTAYESFNLDGLKLVHGDITAVGHYKEEASDNTGHPTTPLFNVSSSTLERVNGSLLIYYIEGLEKIILPSLNVVNQSVHLDNQDLTHLDLTNLEYVGRMGLNAPTLERLDMNGLRGFTPSAREDRVWVRVSNVGNIESVDAFYKYTIPSTPLPDYFDDIYGVEMFDISFNTTEMPNVKHITLGWEHIGALTLEGDSGKELSITFGGPDSSSMDIEEIRIWDGAVGFERSPDLQNLSVGTLYGDGFDMLPTSTVAHLKLPFDQLSELVLGRWDNLYSIENTQAAENWENSTLLISTCPNLKLNSEYNAENERAWYWPKHDMFSLTIHGNLSTEFFASFIENNISVTDSFSVIDYSGELDCGVFKDVGYASCYESDAARLFTGRWHFLAPTVAIMALAFAITIC